MPDAPYTPENFVSEMAKRMQAAHQHLARNADHDGPFGSCSTLYCHESRALLDMAKNALTARLEVDVRNRVHNVGPARQKQPMTEDQKALARLQTDVANLVRNVGQRWRDDEGTHTRMSARLDGLEGSNRALFEALGVDDEYDEDPGSLTTALDTLAARMQSLEDRMAKVDSLEARQSVLEAAFAGARRPG